MNTEKPSDLPSKENPFDRRTFLRRSATGTIAASGLCSAIYLCMHKDVDEKAREELIADIARLSDEISQSPGNTKAYIELGHVIKNSRTSKRKLNSDVVNGCATNIYRAGQVAYREAINSAKKRKRIHGGKGDNLQDVLVDSLENTEGKSPDEASQDTHKLLLFESPENLLAIGDKCMDFIELDRPGPPDNIRKSILESQIECYRGAMETANLDPSTHTEVVVSIYDGIDRANQSIDLLQDREDTENTDSVASRAARRAKLAIDHSEELEEGAAQCAIRAADYMLKKTYENIVDVAPYEFDDSRTIEENTAAMSKYIATLESTN
ncbi:hypothetical protein HOD71_01295 [Candidatus Peribacteria bacterium]|jgi:hypothetical protein|nr:hypothetical protein [Candidatus Peribacteria bacterium]MBT4240515.1 hypothetical protein [Candidatus Peribacteria bacterium]